MEIDRLNWFEKINLTRAVETIMISTVTRNRSEPFKFGQR